MKTILIRALLLMLPTSMLAQNDSLPFSAVPSYPEAYTAQTTVIRMIQGLGYRYYWASEGLNSEDLAYRPSEAGRSTRETLEHIHALSRMILNGTKSAPNDRMDTGEWSAEALRAATLKNLEEACQALEEIDTPLAAREMVWERGEERYTLPFWNLINGPISDALYHTGQVVVFRRITGNPMNESVDVLRGQNRD